MIKKRNIKKTGLVKVTFAVPQDQVENGISVVGDFNNWDPLANPMVKRSNKTYSVTVDLQPGHSYAFRYLADGGQWFNDDEADEYVHDPKQHCHNSILNL